MTQQEYKDIETQYEPTEEEWLDLVNRDSPEIPNVVSEDSIQEKTIIAKSNGEDTGDMRVSELAFNGWVEVWDRIKGDKRLQPRWLLWQTLSKTHPDGSKVFTLTDPKIPQTFGDDIPCYLHPESPDYERLKSMGFNTCSKRHLRNRTARDMHTRSSHKACWRFMEEDKADRIREEDRQIQRDLLKAMADAALQRNPLAEAAQVQTAVIPEITIPSRNMLFQADCPRCGKDFYGENKKKAAWKVTMHKRFCKGG